MATKMTLGYRGGVHVSTGGYRHYSLQIYGGNVLDMAKIYKQNGGDYFLEKLRHLRETTGDTMYFDERSSNTIELRWQSDFERDDCSDRIAYWRPWYAMKVESMKVSDWSLKTLTRIKREFEKDEDNRWRLTEDASPKTIAEILNRIGGTPIKCDAGLGYAQWFIDEWSDAEWNEASHAAYSILPRQYWTSAA